MLEDLDEEEHLWISAAYSKPGMHTYIVQFHDESVKYNETKN
jgi:hypothetical protein